MSVIQRPDVEFDAPSHTYSMEGWDEVLGISTVAKVGGVDDVWAIASAWGFRIGYEGALEVVREHGGEVANWLPDDLRAELKARKLTPWDMRDRAAERGDWVHELLEELATDGTIRERPEWTEEARGHARAVMRWFLDWRPIFVATEVQVASQKHGFAGRYDLRLLLPGERLRQLADDQGLTHLLPEHPYDRQRDLYLCLGDLKTSKDVYPTSHFVQLEGYELAGVEMGYPPTDARLVLQTSPEGEYQFRLSWATSEDFLAYLGALRAIRRIKAEDPAEKVRKIQDERLLAALPATSRELASLGIVPGADARAIGRRMGRLRKAGRCRQGKGYVWERADGE